MTTLQDNAVGPAFQNELISSARLLLLAPSEPRAGDGRSRKSHGTDDFETFCR
jgi:hypothetical protein